MSQFGTFVFNTVVWWRELGEVENECTSHNFSLFAILLPKIIKIGGHLTKFWRKQFCTVFLRHRVCALCVSGSTRRSVETSESTESAVSSDGGAPAGRTACDDYRPSVISSTVPGQCAEESSAGLGHGAFQTLQVPPSHHSVKSKPSYASYYRQKWLNLEIYFCHTAC